MDNVIYKNAWFKLYQYHGEILNQEQLDLMDSILLAVKNEMEDDKLVQSEVDNV